MGKKSIGSFIAALLFFVAVMACLCLAAGIKELLTSHGHEYLREKNRRHL